MSAFTIHRFKWLAFWAIATCTQPLFAQNSASLHQRPATTQTTPTKSGNGAALRDSMVTVKGVLFDKEEQTSISNVRIFFTRREKKLMIGVIANEKGEFSRKIAPGYYDIETQFTGKAPLKLENYYLAPRSIYFIRVEMSAAASKATIEKRR
jgi:hypothetical protein